MDPYNRTIIGQRLQPDPIFALENVAHAFGNHLGAEFTFSPWKMHDFLKSAVSCAVSCMRRWIVIGNLYPISIYLFVLENVAHAFGKFKPFHLGQHLPFRLAKCTIF